MARDRALDGARFVQAPVLSRRSGDALLLLPLGDARPLSLTGTGIMIWDEFREPRSVHDVARALAPRFDAGEGDIERDVERLVNELAEHDALEVRP